MLWARALEAIILLTPRKGTLLLGSAALALFSSLAGPARAQGGWHVRIEAGAVPQPPPPPPVVMVRPYPPPRPVYYAPAPVYPPPPRVEVFGPPVYSGTVGVGVAGVAQLPGEGQPETGGVAVTAQLRASPYALMLFELQWVGAPEVAQGVRRSDTAGLLGLRLSPWDSGFVPFGEFAAGLGQATFECCGQRLHSSQVVGRYALGLEMRFLRFMVFEAQFGRIHRITYHTEDALLSPPDEETSAVELRMGLTVRF